MNVQQIHGLTIGTLAASGFGATVTGLVPNAITTAQKEIVLEAYRSHHGLLCFEFEDLLLADDLHALTAIFGDNEFAPGLINGIGKKASESAVHLKDTVTVRCKLRRHSVRASIDDPRYFAFLILFHNSRTRHWHVELSQRYTVSVSITCGM